jgi:putative addiction module component (TIGR02574 family)
MSAKENVIHEALRLTEAERLEVAEALIESLDGPADPDAEQTWDAEIKRRVEKVDAGGANFIAWPEARRRIAGEEDDAAASR